MASKSVQKLKKILEENPNIKTLVENSIQKAKEINPEEEKPEDLLKRKSTIIKNLSDNINKTTLVKYFNIWKYKKLPKEEVEEIVKTRKKTLIKKRIINLEKENYELKIK